MHIVPVSELDGFNETQAAKIIVEAVREIFAELRERHAALQGLTPDFAVKARITEPKYIPGLGGIPAQVNPTALAVVDYGLYMFSKDANSQVGAKLMRFAKAQDIRRFSTSGTMRKTLSDYIVSYAAPHLRPQRYPRPPFSPQYEIARAARNRAALYNLIFS